MSTITERVARGAAWLDNARPNWFREIDLSRLVMTSPCECVIGQLFGDYNDFIDGDLVEGGFSTETDWGFRHAFNTGSERQFQNLETEWRRVISERRAAG